MSLAEQLLNKIERVADPRPDLTEDSELWSELLTMAKKYFSAKKEFLGNLSGMRACGTRIRMGTNGMYVLRPEIDPEGRIGFIDQKEYELYRDKYMNPYLKEVQDLLKLLTFERRKAG